MAKYAISRPVQIFVDYDEAEGDELVALIRFDYTPGQSPGWTDPGWRAEASVYEFKLTLKGEPVLCPPWLEQRIYAAITEERLVDAVESGEAGYV